MMKITGLSHLFKWENLHNWWLTKYFFAPLYMVPNGLNFQIAVSMQLQRTLHDPSQGLRVLYSKTNSHFLKN